MSDNNWQFDYSYAGPGAKRRKAIPVENVQTTKPSKKPKPVRERLTREEWLDVSSLQLKRRIMALTLAGLNPRQIDDELRDERISVTLVTISNLHRRYREV